MATETVKVTSDPNFQPGIMSPNSKQTFNEMRFTPAPIPVTQKIVLDEDTFEQTFLKCLVCRERYDMADRMPRLLPCHHTFCFTCLIQFFHNEVSFRTKMSSALSSSIAVSITCPTCAETFITTEEGLRQLMTDHRIVQLMDFVGLTDKQVVDYCPKHTLQPLNFFCEKCVIPICRDCTVVDHKECSANQLVLDIHGAIEKYTPALESGITEMEEERESLKNKKEECEKVVSSCKEGDEDLLKDIKETFEKIRKAVDEREQELLEMASGHTGKGKEDVEQMIKKYDEKTKEVDEIIAEIKKSKVKKSDINVRGLFKTYGRVKNYKTEPALNKDDLNANKDTTATFNGKDDKSVIDAVGNFGDIQSSSKQDKPYLTSRSLSNSSTGSAGTGSTYGSSTGSSYSSPRSNGYSGSSRYTSSTYSSYTPRTYRY